MVKLSYTILYVRDVAASLAFYEKAFGLQRKFITPDQTYGELLTGETTLSFADFELASTNLSAGFTQSNIQHKPFGTELGFTTDDVADVVATAVQEGAVLVEEVRTKPWGQEVAYLRDPDGFLIEICTPMG